VLYDTLAYVFVVIILHKLLLMRMRATHSVVTKRRDIQCASQFATCAVLHVRSAKRARQSHDRAAGGLRGRACQRTPAPLDAQLGHAAAAVLVAMATALPLGARSRSSRDGHGYWRHCSARAARRRRATRAIFRQRNSCCRTTRLVCCL
jgi:hypothetical protein